MYPLAIKIARMFFLGLMPLLIISSAGHDTELAPLLAQGTYSLEVEGSPHRQLKGKIDFSIVSETSQKGHCFSVLKLSFNGREGAVSHEMELVISKENISNSLPLGKYKVENVDSFLDSFSGIFGALSSDEMGDKAFFASKGNVRITQCNKNFVKGTLNLVLEDPVGKKLTIKGIFDAR